MVPNVLLVLGLMVLVGGCSGPAPSEAEGPMQFLDEADTAIVNAGEYHFIEMPATRTIRLEVDIVPQGGPPVEFMVLDSANWETYPDGNFTAEAACYAVVSSHVATYCALTAGRYYLVLDNTSQAAVAPRSEQDHATVTYHYEAWA